MSQHYTGYFEDEYTAEACAREGMQPIRHSSSQWTQCGQRMRICDVWPRCMLSLTTVCGHSVVRECVYAMFDQGKCEVRSCAQCGQWMRICDVWSRHRQSLVMICAQCGQGMRICEASTLIYVICLVGKFLVLNLCGYRMRIPYTSFRQSIFAGCTCWFRLYPTYILVASAWQDLAYLFYCTARQCPP